MDSGKRTHTTTDDVGYEFDCLVAIASIVISIQNYWRFGLRRKGFDNAIKQPLAIYLSETLWRSEAP